MAKEREDHKVMILTFFVVATMGLVTSLTLVQRPHELRPPPTNPVELALQSPEPSVDSARNPASVTSPTSILDLDCDTETASTNGNQVRIRGAYCLTAGTALASLAIENETNGFAATVFQNGQEGFSTDYIQLKPGSNRISFKAQLADGKTSERLLILVRNGN